MIFTSSTPEILSDSPFKNDLLQREQYADILTSLIDTSEKGFTMSINATWGYGKTTFIRMWEKKLKNLGYSTVYINAWEKDFIDDPFAVVMATIWEQTQKQDAHIKKPSEVLKTLGDIAGKIIAHRYIGEAALDAMKNGISNDVQIPYALDKYIKQVENIKQFKEQLSVYVQQLKSEEENAKDKLIIFVDELDRCRPDYAIEMLERIKHLFSIDNVIFVLSVDQSVLQETIKGFYGSSNISAENYLRRFIDIEYRLPEPSTDDFIEFQVQYHKLDQYITEQTPHPMFSRDNTDYSVLFPLMVKILFEAIPCSLRDIEKYFNHIEYVIRTLKLNRGDFFVSVFLTYVYIFKRDIYEQIRECQYNDVELLHTIEDLLIAGKIELDSNLGQLTIEIMVEMMNRYRVTIESQNVKDDERLTDLANFKSKHILSLDSKNVFRYNYLSKSLDTYINKIEMTEAIH